MPTEAGRSLTELGRNLLHDVANLKFALTTETAAGELRIGAVPTAITGLMPRILTTVQTSHPGLEIQIVPGQSAELHSKVLNGEVDGAILIEPYFPMPKSCGWAVLREAHAGDRPRVDARPDAHDVLATEPYIRYGHGVWGGRLVENYLNRVGIRPRERFVLST